jgi:mono/diheme cytochrome c family protein
VKKTHGAGGKAAYVRDGHEREPGEVCRHAMRNISNRHSARIGRAGCPAFALLNGTHMRPIMGISALIIVALSACAFDPPSSRETVSRIYGPGWVSTYEKYLPQARAGDPEFQNLIGFMLFFGEGVSMNRPEAHFWFHSAADQGYALAQRNLAIMHRLGTGTPPDIKEAVFYARSAGITDLGRLVEAMPSSLRDGMREVEQDHRAAGHNTERGEATYTAFCAGCHGLNGIATYIGSPSFALGERLRKTDAELLYSIYQGKGVMPSWGDKFSEDRLLDVLAFVRTLRKQYENGIAEGIRRAPGRFFLFGPMEEDDSAYRISFGG